MGTLSGDRVTASFSGRSLCGLVPPMADGSAATDGFALPFALLSSVRNVRESRALVELDLQALSLEVLHDHLLAACAHEYALERLRSALCIADSAQLHAASALCASALATTRHNICLLVAETDDVLRTASECASTVRQYAESNEALAVELAEEGAPTLAAAKERLWLIEASLVHRVSCLLASLRERHALEGEDRGDG